MSASLRRRRGGGYEAARQGHICKYHLRTDLGLQHRQGRFSSGFASVLPVNHDDAQAFRAVDPQGEGQLDATGAAGPCFEGDVGGS